MEQNGIPLTVGLIIAGAILGALIFMGMVVGAVLLMGTL